MEDLKEKISCDKHGMDYAAFVCCHLNTHNKTGFHESFPSDPDNIDPDDEFQAWCDECEQVRLSTEGWTDESMTFADIKLICNRCYFDMKNFNLSK